MTSMRELRAQRPTIVLHSLRSLAGSWRARAMPGRLSRRGKTGRQDQVDRPQAFAPAKSLSILLPAPWCLGKNVFALWRSVFFTEANVRSLPPTKAILQDQMNSTRALGDFATGKMGRGSLPAPVCQGNNVSARRRQAFSVQKLRIRLVPSAFLPQHITMLSLFLLLRLWLIYGAR